MKIVQINCVYEYSSTGRTTMEMHEYCMSYGIESHVFCMNKSDADNNVYYVGTQLDHKLHALWSRIWGMQGFFSKSATRKMVSQLKRIQPDVVILRNLHSNFVNLPILLGYLAKYDIPTIVVLHDCWFFTGHCTHYTAHKCYKWQSECKNCKLMKLDNPSLFFDTSRKMFRAKKELFVSIPRLAVVGVSDWITDEGHKAPIFQNAKIFQRIYNWINLKPFHPKDTILLRKKLGLKDTDFVALGVSMSWDYRKGMEIFFDIAERIPDITIIMIGCLPDCELLPNILNVPPMGAVDELVEYYSLADVLFNFSIQETFGKVAAEALACGTPLIVNETTANPELPGECGFVVKNNDVNNLIRAVNTLRSRGKGYYQQMCVERAHNLFEKDKNIEQYIELFNILNVNS